jgi:hypothetical protein
MASIIFASSSPLPYPFPPLSSICVPSASSHFPPRHLLPSFYLVLFTFTLSSLFSSPSSSFSLPHPSPTHALHPPDRSAFEPPRIPTCTATRTCSHPHTHTRTHARARARTRTHAWLVLTTPAPVKRRQGFHHMRGRDVVEHCRQALPEAGRPPTCKRNVQQA